ncbi:MAG: DUF3179 domain-containing protein, partial [Chloroflexi bacterium]|nr:DUF3179 domain-containing protein [Chloroflexota bacterium]
MTMTWAEWKKLYPDTLILSRDQGFPIPPARYERDPFGGYGESVARGRYPFPVDESLVSDRLGPADIVLTVLAGDEEKAYPLEVLGHFAANDVVGGQPVVVFS